MLKYAAIVFDMDGLMFNTEDIYDEVTNEVLGQRGHQYTREVKISIMGRPGAEALQIIIDSYQLKDSITQLHDEIAAGYSRLLTKLIEPMLGLHELLTEIELRNIPKAVATGSYRRFAETALGHFDLLPRFASVLTSEDVQRGKPDPEIYLKTADALNIEPEEMVVLEDSLLGSQAAAASGATTIAIPSPHCHDCDFSHVDLIAESLHDRQVFELLGFC